jgi:membrane associated rhomboid family serine protease
MFPLKDENPTEITPFVTVAIIAANVLVWVMLQNGGAGQEFLESLCAYGAIPGEITGAIPAGRWVPLGPGQCRIGGTAVGSLFSSMFMHGSWLHLLGNMWFLWVFGNNIEDSMGHVRFIVFYLLTGLLASGTHILMSFSSGVPIVGASGAISGIMGAYIVLYPRVRVQTLIFFFYFVRIVALPAVAWLGFWFLIQLLQGAAAGSAGTGVAFWAHIGGFAAGVALIKLFDRPKLVTAKRAHRRLTREELPPRERW